MISLFFLKEMLDYSLNKLASVSREVIFNQHKTNISLGFMLESLMFLDQ